MEEQEVKPVSKKEKFALISIGILLLIGLVYISDTFKGGDSTTQQALSSPTAQSTEETMATDTEGGEVAMGEDENTELIVEDIEVGDGEEVGEGDKAIVNYVGTLEDGTQFDSSYDRDASFAFTVGAGEVIEGWDKGVVGMKVGGKRKLTIPPSMGYGAVGIPPTIPSNATLIFEVELLGIE